MKYPLIPLLALFTHHCISATLECYMIDIQGGTPTSSTIEKYIDQQGTVILPPTKMPDDGILKLKPNSKDSIPVDFQATLKSADASYSFDIETTQRGPSKLYIKEDTEILRPTFNVSHLTLRDVSLNPNQWTLIGGLKNGADTGRFYVMRVLKEN